MFSILLILVALSYSLNHAVVASDTSVSCYTKLASHEKYWMKCYERIYQLDLATKKECEREGKTWCVYQTPIDYAIRDKRAQLILPLAQKGYAVNEAIGELGTLPLHYAIRYGYLEAVEVLLKAGARIQEDSLHFAIYKGDEPQHVAVVAHLIEAGANLKQQDKDGRTPLHLACERGRANQVKLLLKKGAKINAKNNHGETPLLLATLHRGLHEEEEEYMPHNHTAVIQLLIQHNANVHASNNQGIQAIHRASCIGNIQDLGSLIEARADVNAANGQDFFPLMCAIASEKPLCVQKLLQARANPDLIDHQRRTALHFATEGDNVDVVRLLLAAKADPTRLDYKERTPLVKAQGEYGNQEIAQLVAKAIAEKAIEFDAIAELEAMAEALDESAPN